MVWWRCRWWLRSWQREWDRILVEIRGSMRGCQCTHCFGMSVSVCNTSVLINALRRTHQNNQNREERCIMSAVSHESLGLYGSDAQRRHGRVVSTPAVRCARLGAACVCSGANQKKKQKERKQTAEETQEAEGRHVVQILRKDL
jgi:hypothetical protein